MAVPTRINIKTRLNYESVQSEFHEVTDEFLVPVFDTISDMNAYVPQRTGALAVVDKDMYRFDGMKWVNANGGDGQTSHVHIKYSDDGGTTFTGNGGDDIGRYQGILSDFSEAASTNPADYKWIDLQGSASTFIADTLNDL